MTACCRILCVDQRWMEPQDRSGFFRGVVSDLCQVLFCWMNKPHFWLFTFWGTVSLSSIQTSTWFNNRDKRAKATRTHTHTRTFTVFYRSSFWTYCVLRNRDWPASQSIRSWIVSLFSFSWKDDLACISSQLISWDLMPEAAAFGFADWLIQSISISSILN